jgi:hypothetical protein
LDAANADETAVSTEEGEPLLADVHRASVGSSAVCRSPEPGTDTNNKRGDVKSNDIVMYNNETVDRETEKNCPATGPSLQE